METLKSIWSHQVQIFPLLLAILLLDTVGFLRKLKSIPYVPIYFSAYPLNELNKRVSEYYEDEDPSSGISCEPLTDRELEKLKKRAALEGVWSFVLAAITVPLIVGVLCSLFLRKEDIYFLLIIVFFYKTFSIFHAVRHFEKDAIANFRSARIVFLTYLTYIVILCWTLRSSYLWSYPFVKSGDYGAMLNEALNFLIVEILLKAVVLVILSTFFNNYIMNRNAKNELTRENASG